MPRVRIAVLADIHGNADALRAVLGEYRSNMHTNEPVHTWE